MPDFRCAVGEDNQCPQWFNLQADSPVEAAALALQFSGDRGKPRVRAWQSGSLVYDTATAQVRLQPARIEGGPRWSPAIVIGSYAFFWDAIPPAVLSILSEGDLQQIHELTAEWLAHTTDASARATLPPRRANP